MEYPHLYKDLIIVSIKLPDISLDDGSEWNSPLGMMPPPPGWMKGDIVNVEPTGVSLRMGEEKLAHKIINKTKKKQECHAYWMNSDKSLKNMTDIIKSRKGIIDDKPSGWVSSKEKFNKFDEEFIVKAVSEEFIWLHGDWKWRWYSPAPLHGPWKAKDRVIISKADERSDAEVYKITNVETGKYLMVVPAKEDE